MTDTSELWSDNWEEGKNFAAFLDSAEENEELMEERWANTAPLRDLIDVLESRNGLRIGVITEDWCGDSAAYLPGIAKAADEAGVELRIFERDTYTELRDNHQTHGKNKIPVIVLLDADFNELGRWVERPDAAQSWINDYFSEGKKYNELSDEEREEFYAEYKKKSAQFRDAAQKELEALARSEGEKAGVAGAE